MKMRLLHHFISHIFFPKIGHFDFISDRDLVIMQSIIEQVPINLLRLMMNYMWKVAIKKYFTLPYGMILAQIFRKYRISISIEEPIRALRHIDIYNVAILKRIGFQKVNGVWTKKSE